MERKDVDCGSARIVAASASGEINQQHQYSQPVDNSNINIKTAKELHDLPFFHNYVEKEMISFKEPWGWGMAALFHQVDQCLPIEGNKI